MTFKARPNPNFQASRVGLSLAIEFSNPIVGAACYPAGNMRFLLLFSLMLATTNLFAQTELHPATKHPKLSQALKTLQTQNAWTLEQQISICQIPAPPLKETIRGKEYAKRLQAIGFSSVRTDAVGNIIAPYPLSPAEGPALVYSAHLDTVFPETMDHRVKKEGAKFRGLGMGDDCRGLAAVLAVGRALLLAKVEFKQPVIFVATVGEEGHGNLKGVRHLFEKEMKGKISQFISVDGAGLSLVDKAVGSNRYKVTYKGRGGHSWGAFGMPNPIHALGRAIARIADIEVPTDPKTTFNVGMIEGGTSVNSIPISASIEVDLRSESPKELQAIDERFKAALRAGLDAEKKRWSQSSAPLDFEVALMGIRPAAAPANNSLQQNAFKAAKALKLPLFEGRASSTDANVPMSMGIAAITIGGGGRASGSHSEDEMYEEGPDPHLGPQWSALILALSAGLQQ
jgi:tripeptide aminopeptidase